MTLGRPGAVLGVLMLVLAGAGGPAALAQSNYGSEMNAPEDGEALSTENYDPTLGGDSPDGDPRLGEEAVDPGSDASQETQYESEIEQVALSDEMMERIIAAQGEVQKYSLSLENPGEQLSQEEIDTLEGIATKHGFARFHDLQMATATASLVLTGIDETTGEFVDPKVGLRQELDQVRADENLSDEERQILIEEIEQVLALSPEIEHPGNIEIVMRHKDRLIEVLQ